MAKNSYLFGYSGQRKTLAQMDQTTGWNRVHPELRRRAVALMDDCPHDLGVGNAFRSAAQQEVTFRSRYTPYPSPPGMLWEGRYWRHTSGAPSAPPGRSYHEETVDGWGLAIDFLNYDPAIPWANAHAAQYGLEHLASYAGERWHFQPIEVPRSRTTYNTNPSAYPIKAFALPGVNPPNPQEDDDMTKDEHDALMAVRDALLVRDPTDGGPAMVSRINQTHTIMHTLWDGFPGNIVDGAGSLARTLKRIATHLGLKTD